MARQDHLTVEGAESAPQTRTNDGPPVEAFDDGPSHAPARTDSERAAEPPPPSNQDKPTLILKSPRDVRREEISRRARDARRSADDAAAEEGEGVTGLDMKKAMYGEHAVQEAEEGLAEADTAAETTTQRREPEPRRPQTPDPAVSHDNRDVEIVVNRKLLKVPMRTLRAVLIENDIDPTGISDDAVIASARTVLAARDQLAQAKRAKAAEEGEPQPPQPQFNPREVAKQYTEEAMYGDPDKASEILVSLVAHAADAISGAKLQRRDADTAASRMTREINDVESDFAARPEVRSIIKSHGQDQWDMARLTGGVSALTEALGRYIDPEDLRLTPINQRGRLYKELQSQGVILPSEAEIVRRGYDAALKLFGAQAGARPQSRNPAVSLSADRSARRETVSSQPRAASAMPSAPAEPMSRSDVIARMRAARPR